MLKNIGNLCLVLMVILSFGLACEMEQTAEANKLVNEANVQIGKYNELAPKINTLFKELFGTGNKDAEEIEAFKKDNKAKFDELLSLGEQSSKAATDAADKFEPATKFKLNDKYKEYLNLKVQEWRKRAENEKLLAPFIKSYLESKDVDKINTLIDDYNKKNAAVVKESEEIEKKGDQIQKDNPGMLK